MVVSKHRNDCFSETSQRRLAKHAPAMLCLALLFVGGEVEREERMFGCALFGVVGGHVWWLRRRRRKKNRQRIAIEDDIVAGNDDGKKKANTETTNAAAVDEDTKKKKRFNEVGRKALDKRLEELETVEKENG